MEDLKFTTKQPEKDKGLEIASLKLEQHVDILLYDTNAAGYIILYVSEGSLKIDIVAEKYLLLSHDLLLIKGPVMVSCECCTETVSIWRLFFRPDYLQDAVLPINASLYTCLEEKGFNSLNVRVHDFKTMDGLFHLILKHRYSGEQHYSGDICRICFNIVLHIVNSSIVGEFPSAGQFGRAASFISRFLFLVKTHIYQQHTVKFYADALCVTQGHLARVLKENGSRNPKQIIETALADAAKRLLEDPAVPIYVISDMLNFSSASSFTNFFRRQTQMTPTEYRSLLTRNNF